MQYYHQPILAKYLCDHFDLKIKMFDQWKLQWLMPYGIFSESLILESYVYILFKMGPLWLNLFKWSFYKQIIHISVIVAMILSVRNE